MRTCLLLTLSVFLLASCSDDEGQPSGDLTEFNFYDNATLSFDYPYVVEGNSLVFERYFERKDEPHIADDEYSDQFFFEIVPEGGSFLLEDEALLSTNATFNTFCFCAPTDVFQITGGTISGNERNGVWNVSVDISYSMGVRDPQTGTVTEVYSDVLVFDGLHTAKERPM